MKSLMAMMAVALVGLAACRKEAEESPCTYTVTGWTECINGTRYRTVSVSPAGCIGPAPTTNQTCTEQCRTDRTGILVVQNNTPDSYRIYYQKVLTLPPPEQLWGIVPPFRTDTLTLPEGGYDLRAAREIPPDTAFTNTRSVVVCGTTFWSFP